MPLLSNLGRGECMKKFLIILSIIVGLFVLFWTGSYVKYEVLTVIYRQEFSELYKLTNMIDQVDYLKVMEYSDNHARVYYVTKNVYGNLVTFIKEYDRWNLEHWETVWSKSGSADGFIWPYIR